MQCFELPRNFPCRAELCYLSVLTLNMFEFEIFWSHRMHLSVCLGSKKLSFLFSLLVLDHYMYPAKAFSIDFETPIFSMGLKCNYMGKCWSCSSGTLNRVIFLVHGFGSLKEGGKLCFTLRGHIFTTDTRFLRLLLHMLVHHLLYVLVSFSLNV